MRKAPGMFRTALVSMKTLPGNLDANLERHCFWLERALRHEPDFVGFPEFALTGWIYEREQMLSLASPVLKTIDAWARQHRVTLATGFVERRGKRAFNSCLVTGPRSRLGVMRKINLIAKEAEHYSPGRDIPVFDLGTCVLGVATCADASRFEMIHIPALRGADVIFAPHANSLGSYGNCRDGWRRWRLESWPAFARQACVAIAGMSGAGLYARPRRSEETLKYCGGAMVLDATGKVIGKLAGAHKREGLLVADIDIAALRELRKTNDPDAEFRPAIVYNRSTGWTRGRA